MAWTIEYSDTARSQLRRLDRQMARRVVDYMGERVAPREDPRSVGRALTGPLGGLWRYRVGDCRVVCEIQDDVLRVLVVRVGRRDNVYC
ncbi:MAG: type II toxin-antitoxin system RelE/ParE family toxin [Chloroflexi bacterium]|nr:type II toxin-antitoxin system RelE/ParE family toxin [Chloroflexota bacterium]MYD47752.1 type II toxin-antitoxin system RelE/ParE family toxin [Chloroflexota bacterium]